jgi:Cytochrome P460
MTGRMLRITIAATALAVAAACGGSASTPTSPGGAASATPRDDAAMFRLVSQTDPFARYTPLPNAEEFASGRLNGSDAHRPIVRVSVNAVAAAALQGGRLPAGASFPIGSIVFKEIKPSASAAATLYAVMLKDAGHSLAGDGWLWAEYGPTGSVAYSVNSRGGACISCHRREQGPRNDLVRSFERQQ